MPTVVPELLAARHPVVIALLFAAGGAYALAAALAAARPALARPVVAAGAAAHVVATVGRGIAIGFFPLTNKAEAFSTAALALVVVALAAWHASRLYLAPLLAVGAAVMAAALGSKLDMAFPPPLMRTIWYPLHVPLSFLAYGAWAAAAAAALAWAVTRDAAWLARIDRLALWGSRCGRCRWSSAGCGASSRGAPTSCGTPRSSGRSSCGSTGRPSST